MLFKNIFNEELLLTNTCHEHSQQFILEAGGCSKKHMFESQLENFLAYDFGKFLDLSMPQFPHL